MAIHKQEPIQPDPISNDRDYIVFVRDAANRAFRMLRYADELQYYCHYTDQALVNDVLSAGVNNVRDAANVRTKSTVTNVWDSPKRS